MPDTTLKDGEKRAEAFLKKRCGFLAILALGTSSLTVAQAGKNAHLIFIDVQSTFVVFDVGLANGVNVGSEICIKDLKETKTVYCGEVISSIASRSGYYVPSKMISLLKPWRRAVVTKLVAASASPFVKADAKAKEILERPKYIYEEEDAATAAKWEKSDTFSPERADKDFFGSSPNSRTKGNEETQPYLLEEGISASYLSSPATPITLNQIRFHPPESSSAGEESQLWEKYKKMSATAIGLLIRYTAPNQGGINWTFDMYGRLMVWENDEQNFSPADLGSYVETDQMAWSIGGALRGRTNLLTLGRFRFNSSAGLFLERATVDFRAKSSTGGGVTETFTKLQGQIYALGLTGGLEVTTLFRPVELFLACNADLPLVSFGSSSRKAHMPQPDGATYASGVTNDIKKAVDLKANSLGFELLLGLSYNFGH